MTINVSLNGNTHALIDFNEPVVLPENELKFKFNSSVYNLSTLLVSARNGEKVVKEKIKPTAEFDISELLFPGVIETEISLLAKGEAVKTWRVQDIFIKDNEHTYTAIPELVLHDKAIKEIVKVLKENNLMGDN